MVLLVFEAQEPNIELYTDLVCAVLHIKLWNLSNCAQEFQ